MTDETPLGGGRSVVGVVRVGDTVRRPPTFATPLMRDVLVHLEEIDFDTARPEPRVDDVGYALWKHLNLGLVELAADEQARRARIFVGAYGDEFDVAAAIDLAQEHSGVRFTAHGWDDALVGLASEREWFAANRAAFENRAP